jgi:antibiotic biosynthesis monooxygenase (ABM) superfamily enzyme
MPDYFQTNINLTEEDARKVAIMSSNDGIENRSAWMRWLIRQEWIRRHPNLTPAVVAATQPGGNQA